MNTVDECFKKIPSAVCYINCTTNKSCHYSRFCSLWRRRRDNGTLIQWTN